MATGVAGTGEAGSSQGVCKSCVSNAFLTILMSELAFKDNDGGNGACVHEVRLLPPFVHGAGFGKFQRISANPAILQRPQG